MNNTVNKLFPPVKFDGSESLEEVCLVLEHRDLAKKFLSLNEQEQRVAFAKFDSDSFAVRLRMKKYWGVEHSFWYRLFGKMSRWAEK